MNGIYIHIPFCKRKCAYCDFVSYEGQEKYADVYIDALEREMTQYEGTAADTVFIGGGTPSILGVNQIKRLTALVFEKFCIAEDYEFTIEVNPGAVDKEKAAAMLEGGINRVSVGVQSFNDAELKRIGRIHDAKTARDTVLMLKKTGFDNISLDLMTSLPNQTKESLTNTLKTSLSLPVTHISAYSLIIEEGTPIERDYSAGQLTLPDEKEDREMYAAVIDELNGNGFEQYEISNFAKRGYECRHNIKYWTMQPYIGLGAAAHSFDGECRSYNTSDLHGYIRGSKSETTPLMREDKMAEFMITGLRMNSGVSAEFFAEIFGVPLDEVYGREIEKFISLGLMHRKGERYALTRRGVDVSNSVLCEFV